MKRIGLLLFPIFLLGVLVCAVLYGTGYLHIPGNVGKLAEEWLVEAPPEEETAGELVADAGHPLLSLKTKDSYYNDLDAIYALEDKKGGRLVRIPFEPGAEVTYLGAVVGNKLPAQLTIHERIAYWTDQENIYYIPISGGTVKVIDTGGCIS